MLFAVRSRLIVFAASIVVAACGGGGSSTTAGPTDSPDSVVASVGTIVVGTEQVGEVSPGGSGSSLVVAPGSVLAPLMSVGTPILVPGGSTQQLPLGFGGTVASKSVGNDGSTTVVVQPSTLSEVLTKVVIGSAPVSLDSSNFVGVISPNAVRAAAAARTSTLSATGFNRIELGGGIRFRDAQRPKRALVAANQLNDVSEIIVDVDIPIKDLGIEPSKLKPYQAAEIPSALSTSAASEAF